MGKALYNMKFYSASLSYFDKVVQKRANPRPTTTPPSSGLASLSRQLPDSTGILEKIGKYQRSELDQPSLEKVRDELYFLLGKFYYQKGNFKESVSLFAAVPPSSEFYVQAKLFRRRYPRPRAEGQAGGLNRFKEVLRASAESTDAKVKPFEDSGQPVAGPDLLFNRPVRPGDQVLRPRLAGSRTTGANSLFEGVLGQLHAEAEGVLEGARQHPHAAGAVLRELHQARVRSRRR